MDQQINSHKAAIFDFEKKTATFDVENSTISAARCRVPIDLLYLTLMIVIMVAFVFQRKYYLTVIDKWLSDAFDSLDSINGISPSVS